MNFLVFHMGKQEMQANKVSFLIGLDEESRIKVYFCKVRNLFV